MVHRNVVTVYDIIEIAGHAAIAMEFLDGQRLDEHLARKNPPWRGVLKLFVEAGQGLAAAHAARVVHRDFKPSNVIVCHDGRVVVTDFGLAAPADTDDLASDEAIDPSSALLTATGAVVGTPAYMSPEQLEGRTADARSDQFAFCVALFDALYGVRPFSGASLEELRASTSSGEISAPPGQADIPAWVYAAIVRGLSVDPADRHASMRDLLRSLVRDPRANQRRKWMGVGFAAILIGAVAGTYVLARMPTSLCTGAEKNLDGVWDIATKAQVKTAFLASGRPYATDTFARVSVNLDRWVSQWVTQHHDACEATHRRGVQSEDVLDLRMRCLGRKLAGLRGLVGVLADEPSGEVVDEAIDATLKLDSVAYCADGEALAEEIPPPEDPETRARVATLTGRLEEVNQRHILGKYQEAASILAVLAPKVEGIPYAPLQTEMEVQVGKNLLLLGRYEEAEAKLKEALKSALKWRLWEPALRAAKELTYLVGFSLRRHAEGLAYGEVAQGLSRGLGGEREAMTTNAVAAILYGKGEYEQAEAGFRHAIALIQEAPGPEHPRAVSPMNNLASALRSEGKYEEAEPMQRRALSLAEKVYGPDHPSVASSLMNLAVTLRGQGRYEEAEAMYRRALLLHTNALGPEHPTVARTTDNLAGALAAQERYDEAEALYLRALALKEKALGAEHPSVITTLNNLATVLNHQGKHGKAEAMLRRCLVLAERRLGPEHPSTGIYLANLADALVTLGRLDEAEALYRRSLALREKALGADHPYLAFSLSGLGNVFRLAKKYAQAKECYRRALAICQKTSCEADSELGAKFGLAKTLWQAGDQRLRAIDLAEQARDGFAKVQAKERVAEIEGWLRAHGVEPEPTSQSSERR